jgi:hypothetical protein
MAEERSVVSGQSEVISDKRSVARNNLTTDR